MLQIRGAVWCHTRSVQITLGQYSHFTSPKNTKKINDWLEIGKIDSSGENVEHQ